MTQALPFILGLTAAMFGVEIHAVCALSNHWHLVVTDPRGVISEFLGQTHMLIARCVNAFRGRKEALWKPGRPSIVRLETPEDIFDKMSYVMAWGGSSPRGGALSSKSWI